MSDPGARPAAPWVLAQDGVREAVVPVASLRPGQRLWLANSVRGLLPAEYAVEAT